MDSNNELPPWGDNPLNDCDTFELAERLDMLAADPYHYGIYADYMNPLILRAAATRIRELDIQASGLTPID